MKAISNTMKTSHFALPRSILKSAFLAALTVAALGTMTAQGAQVAFQIFEDNIGGIETAHARWSSDLAAIIPVTLASANPEIWNIDLTLSGHATLGGGDFPSQGGVMTWVEPEHPNLYNNLYFVDQFHWRLESEQAVPANTFNEGFGVFGNGTSIAAGGDVNGDAVFISVVEQSVPEPTTLALVGLGLAVFGWRRLKRS